MKVRSILALALAFGFGLSSRAQAVPNLDFGVIAPSTGSISYAGGVAPLVGTNIEVDEVVGQDGVPLNNNLTRNCIGCVLNFTTGNITGTTPASWTFGPGGSISIVGGVDLNNDGDATDAGDIAPGTTLLTGTFTGSQTVLFLGGTFKIAAATFGDFKDEDLAAFYGLPGGTWPYNGFFNLSFLAPGTPPANGSIPTTGFTSTLVNSGDIVNQPVDLPSSLLLLGSGLVGFAYLTRTRRS